METVNDNALRTILLERIKSKGSITFAEFMAACLYEPGLGYYTSAGRKVGAEGDFYTSSNVHRVFGRLIAREICQMWRTIGAPDNFQIVEPGAAGGRLAADILDALQELEPQLYQTLIYRLIEAEPSLANAQAKMLAAHSHRLAWSTPDELAAGSLGIVGCILSNELVDALPVHVVEMTASGLREVLIAAEADQFCEKLTPFLSPGIETFVEKAAIRLAVGQRAEIRLVADSWLTGVASSLQRGFVITIDYGYLAAELYGRMRMNGTVLCYYQHQLEENPYIRVGLQDITAHVDFSALIMAGEAAGLEKIWYGEQYRFLLATGMMTELLALEARPLPESERIRDRLALKKLMLPDGGMGDTFKVLVQGKNVAAPDLLCLKNWAAAY